MDGGAHVRPLRTVESRKGPLNPTMTFTPRRGRGQGPVPSTLRWARPGQDLLETDGAVLMGIGEAREKWQG